jgi:hypothetical protein
VGRRERSAAMYTINVRLLPLAFLFSVLALLFAERASG